MGDNSSSATTGAAQEEATVWALCWQAAPGRSFVATPWLAMKVRHRLIEVHAQGERRLIDFVLLPSEIHTLTRLGPHDSAASVARGVGNVVSRWVRQVQPTRGPVLAGRFWAQRIESEDAVRVEMRMLAWRPVVQRMSNTPTHHAQGGLRVALGLTTAKGFEARALLQHFGDTVPQARQSLRVWISRRPSEREWRAWELTRGLQLATSNGHGGEPGARSVNGAAAALIAAAGGYGINATLDLLQRWVTWRLISSGAASATRGSGNADRAPGAREASSDRGALAPRVRGVVACLAVAHRLCPASMVARHFHRAKATLSEQMSACRKRAADRHLLATPLRQILEECTALDAGTSASHGHLAPRRRP